MAYIGKRPVDTFPAINAVTSTLIAENNITAREIATNTIVTALIADNAVTAVKIAENVITTRELAANTIATGNIADNAVDGTKIAQNSILTRHIDDAQVTASQLATDSVTTVKIANDQVTLDKMAGIARGKIIYGDASGNPAYLALGSNGTALTSDGTDVVWGSGGKTTEEIQDIAGAMFSSNTETGIAATYEDGDATIDLIIGNNSIAASMIAENVITTRELAANTIATGNIADNAVDGTKIASNSILTRHIDDDQITGDQLADAIDVVTSVGVGGGSSNGVLIQQGAIKIKNGGTQSYIDFYCESSNAHYLRVQAPAHSAFSGNPTITLPAATDTIVGRATTDTLTNKTLTSPNITGLSLGGTSITATAAELNLMDGGTSGISTTLADADRVIVNDAGTMKQVELSDLATYMGNNVVINQTQSALTVSGNTTIGGNLTVNGTTTTLSTTNSVIADRLIELGNGTSGTPANDMGIVMERGSSSNAFMGFDESTDKFIVGTGTFTGASTGNLSITTGTLVANVEGNLTGTASAIADNSVTSAKIVNGTIVAADIASSAVTTAKINADAVTGAKIADDAVDSEHYTDGSIDTAHIADDQVTLAKMAGLARGKIIVGDASGNPVALALGSNGTVLKSDGTDLAFAADSGLSTEEVQDIAGGMFSSNTETGIAATYQDADGTIDLVIGAGAIVNSMLADDAVGADELAANAVVSASIVNGSIVSADIAANTIATSNVADNAIDASKLASNSVLTRHVDDNQITGDQIADNLVLSGTGAITMPDGTTAQRPGSAAAGMFRYNTTLGRFEGYTDAWGEVGGAGSSAFSTNTMTGDGSDTTLTLSQAPDSESDVIVFIDGVFQAHNTYAVSGTTLTFSTAPVNGRVVTAYHVKAAVSGTNLTHNAFSGDGSDTTFTLSIAPVHENNTQVYVDGVYQFKGTYSVSGTVLTFSTAPPNGTAIEVMTMNQTDINVPVDDTITTAKLADNAVTAAKIASGVLTDQVAGISSAANATAITIASSEEVTFSQKVTADAGIDIDNFNIDGTTIALSSGDMTLDVAGDLILDAGGDDFRFDYGGTTHLYISNNSGNTTIQTAISDEDLVFKGNDGGTGITALTLDMSAAGAATFNSAVTATSLILNTSANSSFSIINGGTNAIAMKSAAGDELYIGANNTYALRFLNDGTNNVVFDNGSKLGIGTASPLASVLHVDGAGTADGASGDAHLLITKNSNNDWSLKCNHGADNYGINVHGAGSSAIAIANQAASSAVRGRIQFDGTFYSQDGAIHDIDSDERLKENVAPAGSHWQMFKDLPLQKFKWKDRRNGEIYSYGWIAQVVQENYPEFVQAVPQPKEDVDAGITDPEHLTVLTGLLQKRSIAVIQELMAKVETLEAKVQTLQDA